MSFEDKSFESSLKELELIVAKLEDPDISLDESIELFEKGVLLANSCSKQLETAKQKILTLSEVEKEVVTND